MGTGVRTDDMAVAMQATNLLRRKKAARPDIISGDEKVCQPAALFKHFCNATCTGSAIVESKQKPELASGSLQQIENRGRPIVQDRGNALEVLCEVAVL